MHKLIKNFLGEKSKNFLVKKSMLLLILLLLLLFLPLNLLQQLFIPMPLLLLKDIVNAKGKANAKAAYQVEG